MNIFKPNLIEPTFAKVNAMNFEFQLESNCLPIKEILIINKKSFISSSKCSKTKNIDRELVIFQTW